MKSSLGISNFLEKISSFSHFPLFLYFFAVITEEGFFFNLSLLFFGTLHSNGHIFSFLLCFSFPFFSQLCVRPHQTAILLFCISFFGGMVLIPVSCTMSRTSIHSPSSTLSIISSPLNLFLTSTVQS